MKRKSCVGDIRIHAVLCSSPGVSSRRRPGPRWGRHELCSTAAGHLSEQGADWTCTALGQLTPTPQGALHVLLW